MGGPVGPVERLDTPQPHVQKVAGTEIYIYIYIYIAVDEEESDSSSEMHKQMKIFKPGASYMKAISNNGKK